MTSEQRQRLRYISTDFVSTNVAWLLFQTIRFYWIDPVDYVSLGQWLMWKPVVLTQCFAPVIMMIIYHLSGYYNRVFLKSRLRELSTTAASALIGTLAMFFIALINDTNLRAIVYERFALLYSLLFVVVYIPRALITHASTRKIHRREIQFNTLIIGTGDDAVGLLRRLDSAPRAAGFNIVGFVNATDDSRLSSLCGLPVYEICQLPDLKERLRLRNLIVVPGIADEAEKIALINRLFPLDLSIYLMPNLYHLLSARTPIDDIIGEPLIEISHAPMSDSTANIKRALDIVVSAAALVLLSPVFAAIAVLIKRDSPGPVFYRQRRIGYHKKEFSIIKFRSMLPDAEKDTGPQLTSENDSRITRIGAVMRKYRIDELPQFINVLRGEMSLVGPRPERMYFINRILPRAPYYTLVHQVRPGITSWGMVKYGYASSVDQMIERLRYDLIYLDNVSLGVDLKILIYTVHTIVSGRGM